MGIVYHCVLQYAIINSVFTNLVSNNETDKLDNLIYFLTSNFLAGTYAALYTHKPSLVIMDDYSDGAQVFVELRV